MNNLVQVAASCFINSLWQVAALGGAGWAVSRLFKYLGPRVQHLVWVTTLALASVTPFFPILRLSLVKIGFRALAQDHSFIIPLTDPASQFFASGGFLLPQKLILAIFSLFVSLLVSSAIRLGWSLHCTIALRRDARPVALKPEAEEFWSLCKQAFSVKDARVLHSEKIAGPVTTGFIRPVLLVSERFIQECRSCDTLAALAHECAHMKRRDFQKNLLYEIASLAIAYHPATWFVKSQIARTREMICDDMAAEKLVGRHSYAESLLRLAKVVSLAARTLTSNAIGIFDANVLEERIMMIKAKRRRFTSSTRYGMTAGCVLFLFSVAAGLGAIAWPIEASPQTGSSNSASAKGRNHADLSCTYYTQDAQNQAFEGTCETHKADKAHYYCGVIIGGKKLSEEQAGCEWKIQRARLQKARAFPQ